MGTESRQRCVKICGEAGNIADSDRQRSYWYMQGEFEHDEVHSEGEGAQVCLSHAYNMIRFTEHLASCPAVHSR